MSFTRGISVIIPIYQAGDDIKRCLDSLKLQTLDPAHFEILMIFNGDYQQDLNYFNSIADDYDMMNIQVYTSSQANAGHARNIGIQQAVYSHTAFLDIDDTISTNYLEAFYDHLTPNTVVMNSIYDVRDKDITKSLLAEQLESYDHQTESINKIHGPLTITVLKAIPTQRIRNYQFTGLKSGEDVVFFADFFSTERIDLHINLDAYYYRYVTDDSISRQPLSYDFNVTQRLKVMYELNKLLIDQQPRFNRQLIKKKISAQNNFIIKYLLAFPNDYHNMVHDFSKYHFKYSNQASYARMLVNKMFSSFLESPQTSLQTTDALPELISGLIIKCYDNNVQWSVNFSKLMFETEAYYMDAVEKLTQYYNVPPHLMELNINPWVVLTISAADVINIDDKTLQDFPSELQQLIQNKHI